MPNTEPFTTRLFEASGTRPNEPNCTGLRDQEESFYWGDHCTNSTLRSGALFL